MNTRYPQRLGAVAALAAAMTVPGSPLRAQAASAAAESPRSDAASQQASADDIVILSPFEVTATADSGYAAATSLAGNRLSTELKDVGSAISVVTSQFLRDIGATSNETLLQYTTNTEVGNIYGNMANAGSGTLLDETAQFKNPNANTRVRGLTSADLTTDYFLTNIPWDSYNIDRIDMQRGPNAILFGLGSPAGIINASTKGARMKNGGQIETRYSRFGSLRGSFDYNRVLIEDQLAMRINALSDEEKFQQHFAFQKDERVAGALRYEPGFLNKGSAHTTLKASFESGRVSSNRPRTTAPGDSITPWFLTGTETGYTANGTPFQYNNLNRKGFDARGLQDSNIASIGLDGRGEQISTYNATGGMPAGMRNPYWQPWLGGQFAGNYYGHIMPVFDNGDANTYSMYNWEPGSARGISSTGAIDRSIGGFPWSRMSSITLYRDISKKVNLPGAKFGLTRNWSLTDSSIIDFYNNLIDGPNKEEWQNFHRANLTLTQTLMNGKFGFEAAYDRQSYDNGQLYWLADRGLQIYIDNMQIMADGSVNPNFGRPFIADRNGSGGNSMQSEREVLRLTAYAKHDFAKGSSSLWARILGSHTLTGFYSNDTYNSDYRDFIRYVGDNAYKDFQNGYGSAASAIDGAPRGVYPVVYLGPSLKNATSAVGAHIPTPTVEAKITSGSVRAFDSTWIATNVSPSAVWENPLYPVGHQYRLSTQSENPANYRGWINTPVTITDSEEGNRDANTKGATLTKTTTESKAVNLQSYFWDGALVGMYGYRLDRARAWAKTAKRDAEGRAVLDSSGLNADSYRLPSTYKMVEDNSNSWSGVLHVNKLLKGRLPLDVSFFYNRSQNFQPLADRVGPLNTSLEPPTGRTKDFGILLATKDGRYSLKINRYETQVTNSNGTSGFNSFYLGQLFTEYEASRNKYVFEVKDPEDPLSYHSGDSNQWVYQPMQGQTQEQAIAAQHADIAAWDAMIASLPTAFFTSYKIDVNKESLSQLAKITYTTPNGFSITESNVSKGTEFELFAQPTKGLRLTLNAAKSEAIRTDVGDPSFNALVNAINTALNTTAAGSLRRATDPSSTSALSGWNANFWASWLSVKGQENTAVPELRRWRANFVANYDFSTGFLKGVNVGLGYRWQDKVIVGYPAIYYIGDQVAPNPWLATSAKFDLEHPYYGPEEHNIDLWVGYTRQITAKINWRVQLNVRNVGKGDDLIPVTVQPDGTPAGLRLAPTMVWSLTNTFEF